MTPKDGFDDLNSKRSFETPLDFFKGLELLTLLSLFEKIKGAYYSQFLYVCNYFADDFSM